MYDYYHLLFHFIPLQLLPDSFGSFKISYVKPFKVDCFQRYIYAIFIFDPLILITKIQLITKTLHHNHSVINLYASYFLLEEVAVLLDQCKQTW